MFFCDSKLHKPFFKRFTRGTFLPNLVEIHPEVSEKIISHHTSAPRQKSDQWFQRRRTSKNFHKSIQCKKPSLLPQGHVFPWIKISQTTFEKGHPRNISVKLFRNLDYHFQRRIFKEFLMNISVKLFRNLTTGFSGEFLKNFLWNAIWLPWQPGFFWNKIPLPNFEEDLTRNIPKRNMVQIGLAHLE